MAIFCREQNAKSARLNIRLKGEMPITTVATCFARNTASLKPSTNGYSNGRAVGVRYVDCEAKTISMAVCA